MLSMDPYDLGQVLIVAPEVPFAEIDRGLEACGLERDRRAIAAMLAPLLKDEPELAGWAFKGGKPFVTYTFNPVVALRVLDVGYAPPGLRGDIASHVRLTEPSGVRLGLTAGDARARLRSLWAAGETDRYDLVDQVAALKQDPEVSVQRAAADVTARLQRLIEARVQVLMQLRLLAENARTFIARLHEASFVTHLTPRRDELPRLVDDDLAAELGDALLADSERPPRAAPGASYDQVQITAATAGLLRFPSELSDKFPRGYRDIAPWLKPDRTWLTWAWSDGRVGPGARYDGLVWLDDRWVWLPKVYRLLGPILERRLGLSPAGPTMH